MYQWTGDWSDLICTCDRSPVARMCGNLGSGIGIACPICNMWDGFHDEAIHARVVNIPSHLLLPLASETKAAKVRLTPEGIAALRAEAAARKTS